MKTITATLALLLIPLAIGCSDSGVTEPATDRITVETSTSATAMSAGESSTINITVTRPVGYDGPLTLTAQNLPSGITASFSPSVLDAGESASTLILTADANAPDGSGALIVQASGTDVTPQTATITVTVGDVAEVGSYSMTVVPGSISLPKGGSGSALVAISRTGNYAGAISIDISGFPAGVNAFVSPGSTSGSSASINVTVDPTVLPGTYSATVMASSADAGSQTATLSVTVMTQ